MSFQNTTRSGAIALAALAAVVLGVTWHLLRKSASGTEAGPIYISPPENSILAESGEGNLPGVSLPAIASLSARTSESPSEPEIGLNQEATSSQVWTWEQVEERLPERIGRTEPAHAKAVIESLYDWPRELTPENSTEHFFGIEMTAGDIVDLEVFVYDINAEIESGAIAYVQELDQINQYTFDSRNYTVHRIEEGELAPVIAGCSSANYPGWSVTWPAISFEEHPHLRTAQSTIREQKQARSVAVKDFFTDLQSRRSGKGK